MAMPGGRKLLLVDNRVLMTAAVAAVGVASLASGSAAADTGAVAASLSSHVWGAAEEVPGTAALNQLGFAELTSMSCGAAGNCSAGGFYTDSSGRQQAFVVSQTPGTWHPPIEVPGTPAPNPAGSAPNTPVSCAAAGNCSAGGFYPPRSGRQQAFAVSQTGGPWHPAIEVPGTAALNQGGNAIITSVSCAAAGNCSAGGSYVDSSFREQAFVVSQAHGTWHTAIEVPGTAALNQGGAAEITSVSCAAAGNCSAGGLYVGSGRQQAFVVSHAHGTSCNALQEPRT